MTERDTAGAKRDQVHRAAAGSVRAWLWHSCPHCPALALGRVVGQSTRPGQIIELSIRVIPEF